MTVDEIISQLTQIVVAYGPKLIGAILVWIIGFWVVKKIIKKFSSVLEKKGTDPTLRPFLVGIVGITLKVMVVLTVMSTMGIAMTSFVAILGAAGLAVGLALSGTLQNFAGGVMILIFKPFKVGDVLEAQGYTGKVSEIQIFNTIMKTPDNKTIIIPNGGLANSSMVNYSTEPQRRVDWTFGIGYGDDVAKAKSIMQRLCDEESKILKDPAAFIAMKEMADSSVNFTVRAWVNAEDYWEVFFTMNEKIYQSFNAEGINIPYPQMDVHVHQANA